MLETFILNFSWRVLGPEASLKLERHEVQQTIRSFSSGIVQSIIRGELHLGDSVDVALDGQKVGTVGLIRCQVISAVGLTNEDARRGGFATLDELNAALKRAGYRFKPLIDYLFYRVQFSWRYDG